MPDMFLDRDSLASLLYLLLLLLALGAWAVTEVVRAPGRSLRYLAVWGLIGVGAIAAGGLWEDVRQQILPVTQVRDAGARLEIPVSHDGHYYVDAWLNGVRVRFVIDTGASDIVLSRRDALRAGLDPQGFVFTGRARTANGEVRTARVRIARFELGEVEERDLRAVVTDGEMGGSLLGMAYLSRFARVSFEAGRLVLEREIAPLRPQSRPNRPQG